MWIKCNASIEGRLAAGLQAHGLWHSPVQVGSLIGAGTGAVVWQMVVGGAGARGGRGGEAA
jgi:hypothetical protein